MNDRFANFFLFDSRFGLADQSPGDIIYFLSNDEQINQDLNRRYILTGICTAIIDLCKVFKDCSYCDYLITDDREISFLPVGDDLYFLLSLKLKNNTPASSCFTSAMMTVPAASKSIYKYDLITMPLHIRAPNSRKQILQNVLLMIRKILFLNVEQPKRDPETDKFPDSFKSAVNYYLPLILSCFDWNDLSILQLWRTSVFFSKLPTNINRVFRNKLNEFQSQFDFIHGLILTNKNKIIAHTVDPELANILNFLVSARYPVYYPYNNSKEKENILQWAIGFNTENESSRHFTRFFLFNKKKNDFTNLFTPPLILDGRMFALAALRYNMSVLIIIIDPRQIDVNNDLKNFQQLVEPVLIRCDSFNSDNNSESDDFQDEVDDRFDKKSGAKLFCNFKRNRIALLMNRILNSDFELIKHEIIFANEINLFIRNELMTKRIQSLNNNEKEQDDIFSSSELNSSLQVELQPFNSAPLSLVKSDNSINISFKSCESASINYTDLEMLNTFSFNEVTDQNNGLILSTRSFVPLSNGFSMFLEQKNNKYTNIFLRHKQKGISNSIEYFHTIDDRI